MKYAIVAVALLLCIPSLAEAQQAETSKKLVFSNNVRSSAPTLRTTVDREIVSKEFTVFLGGTVQVNWKARTRTPAAEVRVRVVPSTETSCVSYFRRSQTFVKGSCVVDVVAGANIQVEAYHVCRIQPPCLDSDRVSIMDVSLSYDVVDVDPPSETTKD